MTNTRIETDGGKNDKQGDAKDDSWVDELPDGKTEADTEYDGVLSYAGEWHALVNGLHKGFTGMGPTPTQPDSKKEVHYFRFGYFTGRLTNIAASSAAGYGVGSGLIG